jgi:hypothetical protein
VLQGLGRIIGYGYHPWNAFVISLIVICVGWLAFERGYHSNLVTPTGDKAYVIEKDGTRRLSKNGMPQFSEDYPRFQCVCVLSRDVCAAVKARDRRTLDAELASWRTPERWMLGLLGFPRTWGSLLRLLPMVPHHRRLGSYDALGRRFNWASEDLIVSTHPPGCGHN